jgi:hypothetical protein
MGYRSDVKIVFYLTHGTIDPNSRINALIINRDPYPTLPFSALKLWFEETYPVKEAKEEWEATIDYGKDYILLSYHDVKWYPSYEHTNNVSTAFEKFSAAFRSDERDHRAQYEFVRIGESDDDVERECSDYADHRIAVERSIIFE